MMEDFTFNGEVVESCEDDLDCLGIIPESMGSTTATTAAAVETTTVRRCAMLVPRAHIIDDQFYHK